MLAGRLLLFVGDELLLSGAATTDWSGLSFDLHDTGDDGFTSSLSNVKGLIRAGGWGALALTLAPVSFNTAASCLDSPMAGRGSTTSFDRHTGTRLSLESTVD